MLLGLGKVLLRHLKMLLLILKVAGLREFRYWMRRGSQRMAVMVAMSLGSLTCNQMAAI